MDHQASFVLQSTFSSEAESGGKWYVGDLYDKLDQSMNQAKNSKQEAFVESMEHQKLEKESLAAAHKGKTAQEFRQTDSIEKELAETKKQLEVSRSLLNKFSQELREALDQKLSLESQLQNSYLSETEMEEKLLSAVGLLQKYKNHHDKMQIERDHALQEAEELRKQLAQGPSISHAAMFSEISFSDLQIATNNFDPSLKIGERWSGSSYKGVLHHTEVFIKMFNPNSFLGPLKFVQEVKVLSKIRHPNLINLIGVSPKSWAIVYEYLPNGSLEDRLMCKDNTPSLTWQTRIHIATQLCSVLIFLHSNRPSTKHGDLNPSNILLDENFVCKLCGFRECYQTEFMAIGNLIEKSDIYCFGVTLLRLLTGKPASTKRTKEVDFVLRKGDLNVILDASAGDWPFIQAEQLAHLALRCCSNDQSDPPDLVSDIWRVLEPMKASSRPLSTLLLTSDDRAPHYFICPIFQEIMEDPQIASDGFTYESEAIRGWLDSGHSTSPMTNMKLANHDLVPNRALRSAIQEWLHHRDKV